MCLLAWDLCLVAPEGLEVRDPAGLDFRGVPVPGPAPGVVGGRGARVVPGQRGGGRPLALSWWSGGACRASGRVDAGESRERRSRGRRVGSPIPAPPSRRRGTARRASRGRVRGSVRDRSVGQPLAHLYPCSRGRAGRRARGGARPRGSGVAAACRLRQHRPALGGIVVEQLVMDHAAVRRHAVDRPSVRFR